MMMNELKLKLIAYGKEIKSQTIELKKNQKAGGNCSQQMSMLQTWKRATRSMHIAYSELRGKTRDQIEKPRLNNKPNEFLISEQKAEIDGIPTKDPLWTTSKETK